jgi:hypothetical protein
MLLNLAAFGGTFLTGLPRLTRFSYFLYIPSTNSGPEPVEGLNIPSILSKKWDFLYYLITLLTFLIGEQLKGPSSWP